MEVAVNGNEAGACQSAALASLGKGLAKYWYIPGGYAWLGLTRL